MTYKIKTTGKQIYKTCRSDGESFVRAFARHILPPGFQKVRYYGFMTANCKLQLATARWLAWIWRGWNMYLNIQLMPQPTLPERKTPRCRHCKGELSLIRITDADHKTIWRRDLLSERLGRAPPDNVAVDEIAADQVRPDQVTVADFAPHSVCRQPEGANS